MRQLVNCPRCRRQYDATGWTAGSRFRCRCGDAIAVPAVKAVVEIRVSACSSCGAAQEMGATACRYCQSALSLHERDMHTICPECMTRISDSARFCHKCGTGIHPAEEAAQATDLSCPVCGKEKKLFSRLIGDGSALECHGCAGLWLEEAVFQRLQAKAIAGQVISLAVAAGQASTPGGSGPAEVPRKQPKGGKTVAGDGFYRRCPYCRQLMNRRNVGRVSGVIVDVCGKHGIWFDDLELARLLQWFKDGGIQKSQEAAAAEGERMRRHEAFMRQQPVGGLPAANPVSNADDLLTAVASVLKGIFD